MRTSKGNLQLSLGGVASPTSPPPSLLLTKGKELAELGSWESAIYTAALLSPLQSCLSQARKKAFKLA